MAKTTKNYQTILEMYCPKKMTGYEMADTALFLKQVYGVPYYKIAEEIGVSFNTLKGLVIKYKNEIEEKHIERMEQVKQQKDSNK